MKLTYKVDPEEINNIQNPNVKAFFKELVEATAKTAKTCDYDVTVGATTVKATNIQLLPVKAGLKFFPVQNFYIQGEAGAAFVLNITKIGADNSTAFIYAPQIGYQFALGGSNYIDAGVRYEASTKLTSTVNDSKVNFVGLRVAYGF